MRVKKICQIREFTKSKSSLLIPEYIYPAFEKMRTNYGGTRNLLNILLWKYHVKLTRMIHQHEWESKTAYQAEGLSLKKINFIPNGNDWVKMKMLATSKNVSMCCLFVILLSLEDAGLLGSENGGGVPPKHPKITLLQNLSDLHHQYNRILHLQI